MYFNFYFLLPSVSHFRFPNVYPLHLLSIMFSVFKPCPSLVKLPDCSSLLPSQSCCYMSVYHCLLRSRPSFAFGYFLSPSDFVHFLIRLFFWFDLPACHWIVVCLWTLYFCLEHSVKLATLRESAFGSLPACDMLTVHGGKIDMGPLPGKFVTVPFSQLL